MNDYYQKPFSSNYIMSWGDVDKVSETVVKNFDIRTPSITTLTQNLSGGNQQKLVVGRELSNKVEIAVQQILSEGYRTGDIYTNEDQTLVSCSKMGDLIIERI